MRVPWTRRGCLAAALAVAATTAPGDVAAAPRVLLPNLVALPSAVLHVGGPTSADGALVFACQAHEVANDRPAPQRCLRFETRAANAGPGPLELHQRAEELAARSRVTQRVYRSDGTYRDNDGGSFVLDATHGHFHYDDFAVANLWRSDARGRRLGTAPVRAGRKAGFCLMDSYRYRGATPRRYGNPESCYPTGTSGGRLAQVSGISPGWVDHYDTSVPHQYIEVSGVTDGYYLLQIVLDPLRRLREQRRDDNVVWQRIRLCGDRVDVVGRTSFCG